MRGGSKQAISTVSSTGACSSCRPQRMSYCSSRAALPGHDARLLQI